MFLQSLRVECILSRNHPILQGMPFHVKVNADLHHGQAAQGEAFGIVFQVNLLHGCLGRLVQFQFHDVERGRASVGNGLRSPCGRNKGRWKGRSAADVTSRPYHRAPRLGLN